MAAPASGADAMKQALLSTPKNGINRLRTKGGANNDSLFDLVNGYVETAGTVRCRPGTRKRATMPFGTAGLSTFAGKLLVFAAVPVSVSDPLVDLVILRHPAGSGSLLSKIHYAAPFLGRMYVVAEFANGDVFHYWVQNPSQWSANTIYQFGAIVQPSAENGFVYKITNADPTIAWQSNTEKVIGDFVQPTTYTGFKFQATSVTGATPVRTSDTEPEWPATEGATIVERRYATSGSTTAPGSGTPPVPPDSGVDGGVRDEYGPFPPGTQVP